MSKELIQQARALLEEMKEQATKGTMVPIRVPGQLQAVADLLDQIEAAEAQPQAPPAASGGEDPAALSEQLRTETSQFISTAVHEMRIPLTSIRGYSDMLDKQILGPLNAQQLEFMGIIRSNVLRMERLISDVNDISKLRAKRLHIEPRLDMAKNIIMMAEKATRPLAEQRHQTLTFDVPDGLPLLNVDGSRIAQALGNLIQNALSYSPEGSTVTVTARNADGRLRLEVKDLGIGMTPEEQTHLGEPFWRSDHEVVRSVKGHGLGYAVAKGLVELAGGEMFYETEFEKGSTFGFILPGMS
jgi:signal transduction histidine kinase